MKLKEGMKIKIKSWDEMAKEGKVGVIPQGTAYIKFENTKIIFGGKMTTLCGKVIEITESEATQFNSNGSFRTPDINNNYWTVTEEMFTIIKNDICNCLEPSNVIETKDGYKRIIVKIKNETLYAMDNNGVTYYINDLKQIKKVYSIRRWGAFSLDDLINPNTFDALTELIWEKETEEFKSLPYNEEFIVIKSGNEFKGTKVKFNNKDFLLYAWKDDKGKVLSVSYSEDEIENYKKDSFEFKLNR